MLIVWLETEGDTSESYIAGTFEKSANSPPFEGRRVSFHSLPFEGQQVSFHSLPFEGQQVSSFGVLIFVWVLINVVWLF